MFDEEQACVCGNILASDEVCTEDPCHSMYQPKCHPDHTASCKTKNYDVSCECKSELYAGQYCERITNLCETNMCNNGGTCVKITISDTCCLCPPNFTGKNRK